MSMSRSPTSPLTRSAFARSAAALTMKHNLDHWNPVPVGPELPDTTQCNGNNWFVVDSNGTKIAAPNFGILAHEMSHAMHICLNDLAADPEVQARTDENEVRAEH